MINPLYAIKCLRLGFERYKRYAKLPISITVSKTTASFYVKKPSVSKGSKARVSNHHPKLQKYVANGEEPWLTENVSIEFIVPGSKEDKKEYRARVYQNANGTIQPFDETTYQYNSDLIEPSDIFTIFKAIVVFLNGNGYSDPFDGTAKRAKILPRHSNIKPPRTNRGDFNNTLNEGRLNEIALFCLGDYLSITKNEKKTMNKKQVIRLNETQLRQIVTESVKKIITEINNNAPKEKYTWHIFECDENFENNSELYNSYNESDTYNQMGFTTPEETYNDAMKFVNFYKNDWLLKSFCGVKIVFLP